MADNHISIGEGGTVTRLGGNLRSMVDSYQSIRNQYLNTKATYDQLALGGDWAGLAAALGLTGPNATSNAEAVYNLLGSVLTELNGPFSQQWLGRLG